MDSIEIYFRKDQNMPHVLFNKILGFFVHEKQKFFS